MYTQRNVIKGNKLVLTKGFISYQLYIRLGIYLLILVIIALWETRHTWRKWLITSREQRWKRHLSLMAISQIVVRLIFPILPIGVAIAVEQKEIGIFYQLSLPIYWNIIVGVFILDGLMYWQHKMLHKYRWLWQFHQVHHMDREVDVTTGLRFHPGEMLFTTTIKIIGIGFLGIHVIGVFLFEIAYGFATLFTHANVILPGSLESKLRSFMVTPDMHRIHHSDIPYETNSNFGFCLSLWDKCFNSYVSFPRSGPRDIVLGLENYRDPHYQTLGNMLWVPFNPRRLRPRHKKTPVFQFPLKGLF